MEMQIDTDTTADEILLAATNHDLDALRKLLRNGSANVQDPDTGFAPLHAAIASCEADDDVTANGALNGEADAVHGDALEEAAAVETVKLLFENGAIWNDLDNNDETPGCMALRLGLKEVYDVVVDAGVRAELLLNRLDDYELLPDADGGEDLESPEEFEVVQEENGEPANPEQPSAVVDSSVPELVMTNEDGDDTKVDVNSADYLASSLTFKADRLLDADKNGVMMGWETDIMKSTADRLAPTEGLRILNIGHGMGIIDSILQDKKPSEHHIIEAHQAVLARMKEQGWQDKTNLTVHEGRWQDVVPQLVEDGKVFDAIYFDTFAEDYKELRTFFSEYVIGLLDPDGRFGFFNGLGADRQVCYDVYTKIVEMDLFEAGLDTDWEDIAIPDLDEGDEWKGVRRKYWALDQYRLPTCKFIG